MNQLLKSMIRAFALLVLLAVLGGCALFDVSPEPETYEVRPGDTLYSIAWQNDLDFKELAAWNKIKSPYVIRPGQVLMLEPPEDYADTSSVRHEPTDAPAHEASAVSTSPLPGQDSVEVREATESGTAEPAKPPDTVAMIPPPSQVRWRWPVEGDLLTQDASSGGSGLDIAGSLGQPVRAAAHGKVVYSGGGLQGYGQLVIVKHDDNYLSAYGYNRRLLVRQGDEVHIGQPIAEMGEGPQHRPVLHFEIRRSGKTLDPLQLLPAR